MFNSSGTFCPETGEMIMKLTIFLKIILIALYFLAIAVSAAVQAAPDDDKSDAAVFRLSNGGW